MLYETQFSVWMRSIDTVYTRRAAAGATRGRASEATRQCLVTGSGDTRRCAAGFVRDNDPKRSPDKTVDGRSDGPTTSILDSRVSVDVVLFVTDIKINATIDVLI